MAIDWERRKAEDAEIAEGLASLAKAAAGYQHDAGASFSFASMLLVPLFNCGDGKVRGVSSSALMRNEFQLREGMTFRAGTIGGKEDITPLSTGDLTQAIKLVAMFAGGPAGTILGAIGGTPGSKPLDQLTIAELLHAVGVRR